MKNVRLLNVKQRIVVEVSACELTKDIYKLFLFQNFAKFSPRQP